MHGCVSCVCVHLYLTMCVCIACAECQAAYRMDNANKSGLLIITPWPRDRGSSIRKAKVSQCDSDYDVRFKVWGGVWGKVFDEV